MAITNASLPFPSTPTVANESDDLSSAPLATPGESAPPVTADLMTRVVRGAHDTIDRLAEQAAPQLQRLDEGLAGAGSALHDKSEQWRETGDAWAESLRCTVRDNPLAAVVGALALGVLIARVTR